MLKRSFYEILKEEFDDVSYIGDGVYVTCDGWHIILHTELPTVTHTDYGFANRIALEPEVLASLMKHIADLKTKGERE